MGLEDARVEGLLVAGEDALGVAVSGVGADHHMHPLRVARGLPAGDEVGRAGGQAGEHGVFPQQPDGTGHGMAEVEPVQRVVEVVADVVERDRAADARDDRLGVAEPSLPKVTLPKGCTPNSRTARPRSRSGSTRPPVDDPVPTAPTTASPAPTTAASSTRGVRTCQTMEYPVTSSAPMPPPVRAAHRKCTTSAGGTTVGPSAIPARTETTSVTESTTSAVSSLP